MKVTAVRIDAPLKHDHVRVLHVLGTGGRQATGIAQTPLHLWEELDRRRWHLGALCLEDDGPVADKLRASGMPVFAVGWRGGVRDTGGLRRFAGVLRKFAPHIVHFHAGGRLPRMLARSVSRARIVAHYHSIVEETGTPARRSAAGADVVIVNSGATAATGASVKIALVYQGVRPRPMVARKPRDPLTIGVAARLAPVKGIATLIRAFDDLLRRRGSQRPGITLEIAGEGPEEQNLRESVAELGLGDSVRFLGWRDDIPQLMETWDIYAQPSYAEGFGLSVLEAMAAGLPVVASRAGGLPELIRKKETGLLVTPRDRVALAFALESLVRDPRLRYRLGSRARDHVTRRFTIENEVDEIRFLYQYLLA